MPLRRRFTAKFPTARIKKIMQIDEEIGKLAATVPPVVSRALELMIEEMMSKAYKLTENKASRTIPPSYLKHVIEITPSFAFLKPLVADIPELKMTPEKNSPEINLVDNTNKTDGKAKMSMKTRGRPRKTTSNDEVASKKSKITVITPKKDEKFNIIQFPVDYASNAKESEDSIDQKEVTDDSEEVSPKE